MEYQKLNTKKSEKKSNIKGKEDKDQMGQIENKIVDNPKIQIITLNLSGLNTAMKRLRFQSG